MQPPSRPIQQLEKPTRESALAERARTLLRSPAAQRLRTPAGVNRRGAEDLAAKFYARGVHMEYPDRGHTSKQLTRFVKALLAAMAEHDG